MTPKQPESSLTESLEDYLETIFILVSKHRFARVKDIATARDVRAASVSSALKRLADMGLVNYIQREYVTLTQEGEKDARRVYARHRLLRKFFHEILEMPLENAEKEACAMEHSLTREGMDRLVRFFEFITVRPESPTNFVHLFHKYLFAHEESCKKVQPSPLKKIKSLKIKGEPMTIYHLHPGFSGKITQISAHGAIRQRLIDMGVLPGTDVKMERIAPTGEPVWIVLDGTHLSLRKHEAESVLIKKNED